MATTIKTVMTYPLDGSTTDFNIPFEYLARKFVRVTLIGVDRKELILNQDYRFATKTTISTTRALGPADGYNMIEIRRFTSATDRLVDFTDGSILRAYDLNISQVQTLHVAEEARDLTADTLGVNNDGNLDARGRRIVNLGEAKDPNDALTLGQVQKWNDSALNSANRAKQEADRATNEANRSKAEADRSAQERAASSDWANWSKKWAVQATPVEGTDESSKTYASRAGASAANALQSERNAKTSENSAKYSEINAKNSEVNAKTSEVNARASEERAIEEANKLENWNKLSGTVKHVYAPGEDPENPSDPNGKVIWSYGIDAPALRAYNGASIGANWDGYGDGPFINWYRGKGNLGGTMRLTDGNTLNFQNFGSVRISGSALYGGSGEFSWLKSTGDVVVGNTLHVNGGDYIYKNTWVPSGTDRIVNLIRGVVNNMFRSDDYFMEAVGKWIERGWHIYGGSDDTRLRHRGNGDFILDSNRGSRIILNGDGLFQTDGNIRGTVWGGWLSDWLNRELTHRTNEINHRIHDLRRGGVQEHNSNGAGDWEAPWGYFTGYRNRTGDGNIKFTTWICRQPQAYSNSRGWFDIGGNA